MPATPGQTNPDRQLHAVCDFFCFSNPGLEMTPLACKVHDAWCEKFSLLLHAEDQTPPEPGR